MTESKKGHYFAIQGPTEKKKIHFRLFFVLMLHMKFQIPSSIKLFSSFTTNNNAILVESKKGHNPVNILPNSLKS